MSGSQFGLWTTTEVGPAPVIPPHPGLPPHPAGPPYYPPHPAVPPAMPCQMNPPPSVSGPSTLPMYYQGQHVVSSAYPAASTAAPPRLVDGSGMAVGMEARATYWSYQTAPGVSHPEQQWSTQGMLSGVQPALGQIRKPLPVPSLGMGTPFPHPPPLRMLYRVPTLRRPITKVAVPSAARPHSSYSNPFSPALPPPTPMVAGPRLMLKPPPSVTGENTAVTQTKQTDSTPKKGEKEALRKVPRLPRNSNSTADEGVDGSLYNIAKQNIIEQFQFLLSEHGPQEPSSERVLNLFLALTTHERKVIMTAGSIKGFLSQQGVVALDGNTMLLRDDFKIQSSEISQEEDTISGEEVDEQQLLFEQRASSHGIHIESPPPARSGLPAWPGVEWQEVEVEAPVTASWTNPTIAWSAADEVDERAEGCEDPGDEYFYSDDGEEGWDADPSPSPSPNTLDLVETEAVKQESDPLQPTSTQQHPADDHVNATIQRLQREIVFHERVSQLASQLVGKAMAGARKTMLDTAKCGVGAKLDSTDSAKDTLDTVDSTTCTMTSTKSSLNPALPSFVPMCMSTRTTPSSESSLSPIASVFTPVSWSQGVSTSSMLSASAQIFTPKCSPKSETTKPGGPAVATARSPGRRSGLEKQTQTATAGCTHREPCCKKAARVSRRHVGVNATSQPQLRHHAVNTEAPATRNRRLQVGPPAVHLTFREVGTSTDPSEEDDLIDTIDTLQYDEMVARAAAAEEALLTTRAQMLEAEARQTLKDIETAFLCLKECDQRSVLETYCRLHEDIEADIQSVQAQMESNVLAVRGGAWLSTLTPLGWQRPELPALLRDPPSILSRPGASGDHITNTRTKEKAAVTHLSSTPSRVPTRAARSRTLSACSDHSDTLRPPGLVGSQAHAAVKPTQPSITADPRSIATGTSDPPTPPILPTPTHANPLAPEGLGTLPHLTTTTAPSGQLTSGGCGAVAPFPSSGPAPLSHLTPLLQPMMISLARMNPVLAMQPQLLQATAMQHLLSMQQAGLVPRVPQAAPTLPYTPGASGATTTSHSASQVPAYPPMNSMPQMPPAGFPGLLNLETGFSSHGNSTENLVEQGESLIETQKRKVQSPSPKPTESPMPKSVGVPTPKETPLPCPTVARSPPAEAPQASSSIAHTIHMTEHVRTVAGGGSKHVLEASRNKEPPQYGNRRSDVRGTEPTGNMRTRQELTSSWKVGSSQQSGSAAQQPCTDLPAEEDWGEDLQYDPPVFQLQQSKVTMSHSDRVPEPVRTKAPDPPMPQKTASRAANPVRTQSPAPGPATPPVNKRPKPLPVVASSIDSVPVNVASVNRTSDTSKAQTGQGAGNDRWKPAVTKTGKTAASNTAPKPRPNGENEPKAGQRNRFTASKSAQKNGPGQSGRTACLSDFGALEDDFPEPCADDDWQESKRTKKAKLKAQATVDPEKTSNFDKLMDHMEAKFPQLSRSEVLKVVEDVRQRRGSLKGVKATELVADVQEVVKRQKSSPMDHLLYKTSICEYWKVGSCISGSQCHYAHGKAELRPPPKHILCMYWKKDGQCARGNKCIFAHGERELTAAPKPAGGRRVLKEVQEQKEASASASWATVLGTTRTASSHRPSPPPVYLPSDDDSNDDRVVCVICCDKIATSTSKTLECGHEFHDNCIRRWIEGEERTCPTCRSHALLVEDYPALDRL